MNRHFNPIKAHGTIMIRYIRELKFELFLFTELKMNTILPWTVPLSNVLQQHLPNDNGTLILNSFPVEFIHVNLSRTSNLNCSLLLLTDVKPKYILYQLVFTLIKLDMVHDLLDSIAFYQVSKRK